MSPRILVVDDDDTICLLLRDLLTMMGYGANCAQSCAEGMTLLADQSPPDLVLLDLKLPDGLGWTVYQAMQAHPTWRGIPVVIVTGHLVESEIPAEAAWENGRLALLEKPFSIKRLKSTIDENLAAGRVRVAAGCAA